MKSLLVLLACVRLFDRIVVIFAFQDDAPSNFKISERAYDTEPRFSLKIPGDLLLGGLFSVHAKGDELSCGKLNEEVGIHRLEAMLFAVDTLNQDPTLLPNISVGIDIRDDCETVNTGLEQCLNFLLGSLRNKEGVCSRKSEASLVHSGPILVGVVGPAYSSLAIQVASLLRLFHVPEISYSATSSELSDKNRFDYFVRTVPPDSFQSQAIVDIIHSMNWSAVYAINSRGSYGEGGMRSFEKFALRANICTVYQFQLEGKMKPEDYDELIKNFLKRPDVRVVVLFCVSDDIRAVLSAAKRQSRSKHFIWLASDFWGSKFKHLYGLEDVANGAISIELKTERQRLKPFYDYFFLLRPDNNTRNPWFKEYWENHFRCRLSNTSGEAFSRRCHGNESYLSHEHYDSKVSFVIDAVFAFGHAMNSLHQSACGGKPGICDVMRRTSRTQLISYLYNVTFNGTNGHVRFDENGDAKGRYDILQFRENVGKSESYHRIGSWIEGDLTLKVDKMSSYNDSQCGVPCEPGHARSMLEVACCWSCVPCEEDEYLKDDYTCTQCPPGQKPNSTFQGCDNLPIKYLGLAWVVIISTAASVGLFVTLFVVAVFIKFMRTPLIMAAGRELSAVLFFGIILSYSLTFVLILEPSHSTCIFRRFGTGFVFCLCYASLLVRTNRIARIFSGTKSPSFISPQSQLIITALILSPQIVIALVELFVIRREIQYLYDNSEYIVITCGVQTFNVIIQFIYSGILIILCTYYAFKTRKTPLNFNEAKFIGFCMYTTCVIWIAFLPMYYGIGGGYETIAICCSLILSATTILVFIFVPKVYIVLFKPEKNLKSNSRLRSRTKYLECAGNDATNSDSQGSANIYKGMGISNYSPSVIKTSPGTTNSSGFNFDLKTLQVPSI